MREIGLAHPRLQRLTRRAPFIDLIIDAFASLFQPPSPSPKEQAAAEESRIYEEAEKAQLASDENAEEISARQSIADAAKQKAQNKANARVEKEKESA
ncbi:hypothetical protein IWQ61_009313 [Dispira simplex]|nr:hypothetical protein IWQ61_009313 [Dispira simplex]